MIAAVAVTVAVLVCGRSSGLESLMNSALTEKEDPTLVTFRSLSPPSLRALQSVLSTSLSGRATENKDGNYSVGGRLQVFNIHWLITGSEEHGRPKF